MFPGTAGLYTQSVAEGMKRRLTERDLEPHQPTAMWRHWAWI